MPVAYLLLCFCYMLNLESLVHAPSVSLDEQNETNTIDSLVSSLMEDVIRGLNETNIDYAKLTSEYNKICPSLLDRCRICSCNTACWKRQNCCPNCPHAFLKRGCVNIALMGETLIAMLIDQCPHFFEGDDQLKELCGSNTSVIAPVSYMTLNFKNKYCAICHGIAVYEPWEVEVRCQKPIPYDMKLDKTLEETLGNFGCDAALQHPNSAYRRVSCRHESHSSQIDRCNVTGLLKDDDKGLSWACKSLNSLPSFGVFKNVYCYLCNPSIASTTERPPIKSCISNETCSSESGLSERLSPYGSVCVMECNGIGRGLKFVAAADENVTVTTKEIVSHTTGRSNVEIQLRVSDTDQILTTVSPFFVSIYGEIFYDRTANTKQKDFLQTEVNYAWAQEQIRVYSAICGDRLVCDKSMISNNTVYTGSSMGNKIAIGESYNLRCELRGNYETCRGLTASDLRSYECTPYTNVPSYLPFTKHTNPICGRHCSCEPDCLQYDTCCADVLLQKQPFSCNSEAEFSVIYPHESDNILLTDADQPGDNYSNAYSVVSGCLDESSIYLNMCTSIANNTDMLSRIPVSVGEASYKNVYCMLCNQAGKTLDTFINIELECNSYLEDNLFRDLRSLLSVARNNCKTKFKPKRMRPCKKMTGGIHVPDQLYASGGNMSLSIKDIKVFSKCNETGLWADDSAPIRQLCEDDSVTSSHLKEYSIDLNVYKNFACFECNPDMSMPRRVGSDMIIRCEGSETEENAELFKLCSDHPTHARWFPYKNLFCAQCNKPPPILLNVSLNLYCGNVPTVTYTYRNLFSLVPGTRTSNPTEDTTCAGIYDTEQKVCRVLHCGEGSMLVDNTCKAKEAIVSIDQRSFASFLGVTYQLRFRVTPDRRNTSDDVETVSLETLCSDLLNSLWDNFYDVSYSCKIYNVSCETTHITVEHVSDLVFSYIVYNMYVAIYSDFKDVVPMLVESLSSLYIIESDSGKSISLRASPVNRGYDIPPNIPTCAFGDMHEEHGRLNLTVDLYVDKFLNCPHVRFDASAVHVDPRSGSITLHHDGTTFEEENYHLNNGSFIICKQDLNSNKMRDTNSDQTSALMEAYAIFNKTCILLSLVCLLITFVTFSILKALRTTPGKNIMTLTLTMFTAQLLMLVAPFIHTSAQRCVVLGATIHYFWVAMFCAMFVCSFHLFKLFYIGCLSQTNRDNGSIHTVLKYNVFVFGLPLMIVSLVVMCNMSITDGSFSGYLKNNSEMCFIDGFYPIIFAFILPVTLLNIASIVLFSMSFHKIRTAPHMRGKEDRNDVIIYIKLCTIVGVTWPLQIVDAAVDMSVLSFIVVCFNALQGVFIFIAYICKARVLKLYKTLIERKTSSDTFSPRSTTYKVY